MGNVALRRVADLSAEARHGSESIVGRPLCDDEAITVNVLKSAPTGEARDEASRLLRERIDKTAHRALGTPEAEIEVGIRAIPQYYHGVRMRSRLATKTALLFDRLGWEWKYEPFSVMLPSGLSYKPDFYIPEHRLVVECRGYREELKDRQLDDFAAEVPTNTLVPECPIENYAIIEPDRRYMSFPTDGEVYYFPLKMYFSRRKDIGNQSLSILVILISHGLRHFSPCQDPRRALYNERSHSASGA